MTAESNRPEGSMFVFCRGSFLHAIVAKHSPPQYPGGESLGYTASNRQPSGLSVSSLPWCFAKKTARGGFISFPSIYDKFGPISS
jgi:hypothetical protein